MQGHPKADQHAERPEAVPSCPRCDASNTITSWEDETFTYGSDEAAAELRVQLPVRHCQSCGLEFLDHDAERLEHEAVCRHLKVLNPAEVRAIRTRRNLTRNAFARLTGLGEATIKRWENAIVIQNPANDRYLRILDTRSGWAELQRIAVPNQDETSGRLLVGPWQQLTPEAAEAFRPEKEVFSLKHSSAV